MPTCRVCSAAKEASDFYPRQLRQDGAVGECKDSAKARVREQRAANLDYYRSYDRFRYRAVPERAEACQAQSRNIPADVRMEPEKYRARNAVSNGLRDGRVMKADGCFFCGAEERLQAHHHDYSKPLDVFWLCPPCHGKLHAINGDFHRPKPGEVA